MSEPIHVLPVNDLREHTASSDCWCKPALDADDSIYVHHSMDRREEYENGRKPS
jgi:hypothetical protein